MLPLALVHIVRHAQTIAYYSILYYVWYRGVYILCRQKLGFFDPSLPPRRKFVYITLFILENHILPVLCLHRLWKPPTVNLWNGWFVILYLCLDIYKSKVLGTLTRGNFYDPSFKKWLLVLLLLTWCHTYNKAENFSKVAMINV